ncbi:hypothetical protein [Wolbachia endosymbiont of Pentidionis agamae]|uniref:hypothetical protein n=1 Tax=Wolbachia endosymbiont of Pentidionis agamae TaxID=3110435 RepID=UPI002FD1C2E6
MVNHKDKGVIKEEGTIDERLEKFISVFVNKFEAKLDEFKKEAEVGGKAKTGKIANAVGTCAKAIPIEALKDVPSSAVNCMNNSDHRKKAKKIVQVFSNLEKIKIRRMLIEASGDIFKSFEKQFMEVTDTDGGYTGGMEKLAVDARDRAINHIVVEHNKEISAELIVKGIILGVSKINHIENHINRKGGFTLKNSSTGENNWKTESLYTKTGFVVLNGKSNNEYYSYEKDKHNGKKYGYRIPLKWEIGMWNSTNYKKQEKPSKEYVYTFVQEREMKNGKKD